MKSGPVKLIPMDHNTDVPQTKSKRLAHYGYQGNQSVENLHRTPLSWSIVAWPGMRKAWRPLKNGEPICWWILQGCIDPRCCQTSIRNCEKAYRVADLELGELTIRCISPQWTLEVSHEEVNPGWSLKRSWVYLCRRLGMDGYQIWTGDE
jgi:hypothetical protein